MSHHRYYRVQHSGGRCGGCPELGRVEARILTLPSSGLVVRAQDQPLRVAEEQVLTELADPDGRSVVLLARIWHDKITRDHPELREHLGDVLATVQDPDHAEPDPRLERRRYYRRRVGPSRWLLVVVSFEQQPGRIITAVATRKGPKRWKS